MKRILLILALFLCAAPVAAQDTSVGDERIEIQLQDLRADLSGFLALHTPETLRLFVRTPITTWLEERERLSDAAMRAGERAALRRTFASILDMDAAAVAQDVQFTPLPGPTRVATNAIDTVNYLPLPPVADTTKKDALPGVLSQYADLGISVTGNGQLGGSWTENRPCDVAIAIQCRAGVFPQLQPDMTFGVRVAGTVSQRIHVNVNFDQKNEFDAANNLNVSYQGLPDEILQRVDVGDVSIRLPTSRYMTRGIPAGNFGLRATGQLGPLDFQTVFAQQKGDIARRQFTLSGAGSSQSVVQQQQIVEDDAGYVKGQFFYLVDPARIANSPYFDALSLRAEDAPADVRPRAGGIIAIYRDERITGSSAANAELGRFLADAAPAGGGPRHSGTFRRLTPDVDYVVHASGLWITLKSPLRQDEALAMAYVTQSGDTIGNPNAEQSPPGVTPVLRLLRGPASVHQPGAATWDYEMHNVYRLDSSAGVDLSTIDMKISLGDISGGKTFQTLNGAQATFVKLFGLDEDAPSDRIDEAQIYQPSRGNFGTAASAIPGTFIIFPAVRPFSDPAGVPSLNLSAAEVRTALGSNANTVIYNDPDPVNRDAGARFKLNFSYSVKADGLVSSFNLGAFGIRDESERIMLGTQQLVRGVDYDIDYDVGLLTLRDPGTLFSTHPGAELSATWEQKPLFQIAPTSVFGMNARYAMGRRGELDVIGLYQAEKSLMARPTLGTEPGSIFLGGFSGSFDLGGALLDRAFSKLPGLRLGSASHARITGELAMSSPNPNSHNDAYVEDFEATDEIRIDPRRSNWVLGSRPQSNTGDMGTLPFVLNTSTAAPLTWTHDFLFDGRIGGAFQPRQHLDNSIRVVGNEASDYEMYLNFGVPPVPGSDPRHWRSITTVLSATGMDLSRSEYLEFYVNAADTEPLALVFDLGTVSEDAFYVDSAGNTNGIDSTGRPWGLGVLDEEAHVADREVWGTGANSPDSRGLWNQTCTTSPTTVYPLNDNASVNCTRNNGIPNTEDLDGNGVLSADDGAYFRYVVTLDQLSQYLVRTRAQTSTPYQLYRIPLRSGTAVNGANEGTWRFIRNLRMTVTGAPSGLRTLAIARMRIVGSRWTKRDVNGTSRGIISEQAGIPADVHVGPVSIVTDPLYRTPANANADVQDPNTALGAKGVENNEKSLRISYDQLAPDQRAEVYYRYPQQARSFMTYRQMRLWALPKDGVWGVPNGERLVIKVGSDARNFYLFQTRLRSVPDTITPSSWLPEIVVDFDQWFALKDLAERRQIENPLPAGVQDTVWSADSAYAIVLEDRARAPNLQQIRELSFAVYNGGTVPATGEVWIDDVRLTGAERGVGRAAAISLEMNAGDFLSGSVSFAHQDDVFQQLNESAPYIAAGDVSFNADAHLDRLLPASLGIDLPVSVTHTTTAQTPTFLQNTDVLASGLGNLRETGGGSTRIGVRLSKRTPTANPWMSIILDGTALRFGYTTSSNRAITSRSEIGSLDAGLSYSHPVTNKSFDVVPGFVEVLLRGLVPRRVEESDAFRRLVGSHLRLTPDLISFNSGYNDQMARSFNYDRILSAPEDSLIHPIESPRRGLQSDIRVAYTPFVGLSTSMTLASSRDLLDPERAALDPRTRFALERARRQYGGIDVGWETNRTLTTSFGYKPQISNWIAPEFTFSNNYLTDRNPSYLTPVGGVNGDTTTQMQHRFESGRQVVRRLQLFPGQFGVAAFGPMPKRAKGMRGFGRVALQHFEMLDLTWRSTLTSQFDRESLLPGVAYQIGLGDLHSFKFVGLDTAARALQTTDFRTTAGYTLAKFARLDFAFGNTRLNSFDIRGGERVQNDRTWPHVGLNLHDVPLPDKWKKFLENISLSGGVDRVRTVAQIGTDTTQNRRSGHLEFPVNSTLTFPHAVSLTYTGKFTSGDTQDPTGRRETLNGVQTVRVNSILPAPRFLGSRFTQPLAASLSFTQVSTNQCGSSLVLGTTGCTKQVQTTSRQGRIEASTGVDQMRLGLSLDYTGNQNYVGTQTGHSQFIFSLFGNFVLNAGTMPSDFGGIH